MIWRNMAVKIVAKNEKKREIGEKPYNFRNPPRWLCC
jgi:hypothetical protein